MFVSYAQNYEDVILRRVLHDVAHGFFVDVGAHDPEFMSLTKHFSDRGWRGINIEPSSTFQKFPAARPNDINLQLAVSDHNGTAVLHEYPAGPGLTTLEDEITEPMKPYTNDVQDCNVTMRTLASIFEEHANNVTIDFISIDVEGHERAVLLGNDWNRFRPRVLVIEATESLTQVPTHHKWEDVLRAARYVFAYFDGLNRFYVRIEDAQLLTRFGLPPNVFDNFTPARTHQLDLQVQELHGYIATWKTAHDNALSLAERLQETIVAERQVAKDWEKAHDNAVAQVVEAREEVDRLKIEAKQLHEANHAACVTLEQAATELERQSTALRESQLLQAGLRSQVDQMLAHKEQQASQLAEVTAELKAQQISAAEQNALLSEYRGLCRHTSGRPLKVGLWVARLLSALRFKPRPPYPV